MRVFRPKRWYRAIQIPSLQCAPPSQLKKGTPLISKKVSARRVVVVACVVLIDLASCITVKKIMTCVMELPAALAVQFLFNRHNIRSNLRRQA